MATPVKKAGAKVAFQQVGQGGVGVHLEGLGLGVQVGLARGKQHVAACGLQGGAVGFPGAGVAVKVFVGQELQAVHKMLATVTSPRGLAWRTRLMWPSCRLPMVGTKAGGGRGQGLAQFVDGVGDEHGTGLCVRVQKGLPGDLPGVQCVVGKRPCLTACT